MAASVVESRAPTSGGWEPPVRIEKDELVRISDAILAEPDIPFDEIEDISPLPKGNYRLAAKKWKEKKSKNDNTYIKVEYQVLEPAA